MRQQTLLATALIVLIGGVATAHAEDIDWKKGILSRLVPEIGTYHFDKVLSDPSVNAELNRRLGSRGTALLRERLEVQSPIGFDGTALVLQGNMAHAGTTDAAILSVQPKDGQIQAAILVKGTEILISIDQFMPSFPNGEVQRQTVAWKKAPGARVKEIQPSGR